MFFAITLNVLCNRGNLIIIEDRLYSLLDNNIGWFTIDGSKCESLYYVDPISSYTNPEPTSFKHPVDLEFMNTKSTTIQSDLSLVSKIKFIM